MASANSTSPNPHFPLAIGNRWQLVGNGAAAHAGRGASAPHPQRHRAPTPNEAVNLSLLLADVADSLRPLAEAKGLGLIVTLPDAPSIPGDSDGLIRLFVNLLDNAIKYTARGHISVSARPRADGLAEVTIADTGIGIAAEHLPHIFDRFYQVDRSRGSAGAGLGLAIAQSIAQAHGGRVEVESECGNGTTFAIILANGGFPLSLQPF